MVERKRRSTQTIGTKWSRRKTRRTLERRRSDTKSYNEIPGLFQVKMSLSLQSVLSCRIGINITSSERWMYIYKKKLLDELKRTRSSINKSFFKIIAEIQAFPDEYILIGSYGHNDFLLCLSEYAKNVCENWKEEEKRQLMENLQQFLSRDAFQWHTLGSDNEIERVICNRSPLCVQLVLKPHLNIKFDTRLVNDTKDGYAEFVNTRTPFNILYRRRLDKASQVSKEKLHQYTQTIARSKFHRGIQYSYAYAEAKTSQELQLKLNKWFAQHYNDISSSIRFNASINIYKNDYMDLPNQKTRYSIENPNIIISFHDCISCPNKMVSCIAWNAQISGVIAVAYARDCPRFIKKEAPEYRSIPLKELDTHLVLVWSVTQPNKPLLYLHAQREVTAMNFCPYNPYILVGGCSAGQIIVWDMNGKLDGQKLDSPIQSTEVAVLIKQTMGWMKYPPDEQNVFPCIESKMETGHKTHITVVKWLPPEYELNNLGEFVKCEKDNTHMQFLTAAIGDSTMLAWDLKPTYFIPATKRKQKKRLSSRPKTLDEKKSPFSILNTNFKPVFKLVFVDSNTKGRMHINDFSFKMGSFSYSALNPETLDNMLEQTNFIRVADDENIELERNFLAATEFGQLYHCSWDTFDYDQGLEINMQHIDTISCKSYHDGPIYHMQRSPFCADLILTTGGRVFAIWDNIEDHIQTPLLWRKAEIRYVMAVWSIQNSASIVAAREDGKIELWDFAEDSKLPLRMTKLIGDQLLSLFVNNNLQHVMKGTCITTDLTGILSIYDISSKLFVYNKESQLRDIAQQIYEQRDVLNFWREYIKRKRGQIDEPEDYAAENQDEVTRKRTLRLSTETKNMSIEVKKSPENIWQEKEYKRMYKILIEKHRINLANIEKNKRSLNKVLESRYTRTRKIDRYIASKEKVFREQKNQLTSVYDELKKKSRISVQFPKELVKMMKEQYYENYKIVEREATKYIQSHRYRYFFDWKAMMFLAKNRYNGEFIRNSDDKLVADYKIRRYLNLIPSNVDRKTTKTLMTQIALVASISGK